MSKSDRKNQELYDFNCMWDIKLRTTNEQTDKETDKQKLIDSRVAVTMEEEGWGRGSKAYRGSDNVW